MQMNDQDLLKFAISQGIINLDDVRADMEQKQRTEILKQHKYKISQGSDGRWKTTLPDKSMKSGRRLVAKTTLSALEDAIISFYQKDEASSSEVMTLADLYPRWIKYRSTLTKSSSTIKRFKSVWNTWLAEKPISGLPMSDLSYLYLNEWANTIVKEHDLTKKAYYLISSVLNQILDYAVELGCISKNSFKRVKVACKMFQHVKKPESETQVFLEDEQAKIAKAAKDKFKMRPWCVTPLFILLNFQLGLRIGELVALRWEDIDDGYLSVQRMETTTFHVEDNGDVIPDGFQVVPYVKSEAGFRRVYLNHVAREIISDIRKANLKNGYNDDGYMFIASKTKRRGTSRSLTKYLDDLCKFAGVNHKSNHKIRKTYISSLFDCGVNINTIREQAGHEDERTSLNNYCFDSKGKEIMENELESAANKKMIL